MKAVFMGTPEFAAKVLEAVYKRHEVLAVLTQPDKPAGRGKKIKNSPVKELAIEHGTPVLQPEKLRAPENIELIQSLRPDVILVAAYGQILPKTILYYPKYGCINVHASLLPKYRGAAPINWALINGENESGVTIMQMDAGIDTGDMILQRRVPIHPEETCGELYSRLAELGAEALIEVLEDIEAKISFRKPQSSEGSSYAPMISAQTGRLDWSKTGREIVCLIRGLNPSPGAYTFYEGSMMKIWKAKEIESAFEKYKNFKPGEIIEAGKEGILIRVKDGSALLETVQAKGGKIMPSADYLRGHPMKPGTRFD
ncbi:MAG: methionyl-tRNA formyltransferase [Clostridiales bacterium]|jgi:methionyl-tRNA formyltransferase|nr:methionyl-tRNA formyltransferase [Clostridiales bacterium]